MESQPQNPDFSINPENFHPCLNSVLAVLWMSVFWVQWIGLWLWHSYSPVQMRRLN